MHVRTNSIKIAFATEIDFTSNVRIITKIFRETKTNVTMTSCRTGYEKLGGQ